MLSVGNRDGRKRMIGLGLEMEETELEEGEALSYQNEAQDSTIDPDVALSYIGEKLQNVLGHFQKDFEGGVSYENLGAKFGGYGSFLPSHQRSPSWSHTRSPAEAHYHDSPRKLHLEDKKQNSFASSRASPSARARAAPGKALSVGNSSKGNNGYLQFKHAEESNIKSGGVKKPVINTSDQRTLKVRIKVGSENMPTQKNADIYSGLGLVVSPSSSLDDSPTTSEGQFCNLEPEASPTSILQIMTSCPGELLLSPLSEDLINLLEKRKPKGKFEAKPAEKINQKKLKPSRKDEVLPVELTNQKNHGITDINVSLLKEKEPEIDTLGCEELVSNALKLPLLTGSQNTFFDPAKDSHPTATNSLNGNFNNESVQDNSAHGKISEYKKGNHDSNMPVKPLALDQPESIISKGRKEDGLKPAPEKSSTGGKRKQKVAQSIGSQGVCLPKNDPRDHHKYNEKPVDRYKDFFGDAEFEDEDKESISGDRKSPQIVGKRSSSEDHNLLREKFDGKDFEKPQVPESYHGLASQSAPPPLGYGPGSEAPIGSVPLVKEDWVLCDKCRKWRLLPLGTNLKSLPDKWLCRMLTWLPGMNRCSVPQEETTNALRALYHPAPLIPAPTSDCQHSQLNNNSIGNPVQVAPVDDRYPGQENLNISLQTPTICGKKKSTMAANSTDHDGSTNSSNSHKKNFGTSGNKVSNLNSGKNSPSVNASGYQHIRQSSSAVEKYADPKKEKSSFANSSDKDEDFKIKTKREADMDGSRSSKRMKSEELRFDDDNCASDNGGTSSKSGRGAISLSNNTSGNGRHNYTSHNDLTEAKKEIHVLGTSDKGLFFSEKREDKESVRKRKSRETSESDHQKEKKSRVSKSGVKDSNGITKASVGSAIKSLSDKDENNNNAQYPSNNTLAADYLKSDIGSVNPSVPANSSSSKVSGSHKNKTNGQEIKGSPVESISSSPLKYPNADKAKILIGKDGLHDPGTLNDVSTKGLSHKDERDIVKKEVAPATEILDDKKYVVKNSSENCKAEEKSSTDQSQKKKSGKGLSSHSKGKTRAYGSDLDKVHNSSHDSLDLEHLYEEKSKSRRNKSEEKYGTPSKGEKFIGGTSSESSKGKSQKKPGHNGKDVIKSQDKKHRIHEEHDNEKLLKKINQVENNGSGKSHSLPPLARIPAEPVSGPQKENGIKSSSIEALDISDAQKAQNSRKKSENLNGQPIRHPTPNSHKARDLDAPSPVQRDSSSHAANSALKEAKDLKHLADRLKNSGSTDSNGFYFQAALKFLHGASLLESGSSEGTKHNDLMHSMHIYGSTAKLCEFCAREYEKSKDMAAAALAYKCMEIAYMRVVYSSHASASRDRNELQTALQIVPPGESPSSSASDVDNLNNQTTTDKVALAKVVGSPQVSGSHAITSRNRSGFLRILNFAQDVNSAMEASRKSRIAFSAATASLGEPSHKESINSLKKALDFNFQDIEVLLRLVRIAMETISR